MHLSMYCSIRVHPVLHHRSREGLQLDAGHNAPESQRKNRDVILGNEDLEDLIESIPHHDQIMHSIQEMYPRGMVVTY